MQSNKGSCTVGILINSTNRSSTHQSLKPCKVATSSHPSDPFPLISPDPAGSRRAPTAASGSSAAPCRPSITSSGTGARAGATHAPAAGAAGSPPPGRGVIPLRHAAAPDNADGPAAAAAPSTAAAAPTSICPAAASALAAAAACARSATGLLGCWQFSPGPATASGSTSGAGAATPGAPIDAPAGTSRIATGEAELLMARRKQGSRGAPSLLLAASGKLLFKAAPLLMIPAPSL